MNVHVHKHVRMYVRTYLCMYVGTCRYVHTYVGLYVHTYVRMYLCTYDAYTGDELTLTYNSSIVQLTACWLQAVSAVTQSLLCSCACDFCDDSRGHYTTELLTSEVNGTYRKGDQCTYVDTRMYNCTCIHLYHVMCVTSPLHHIHMYVSQTCHINITPLYVNSP